MKKSVGTKILLVFSLSIMITLSTCSSDNNGSDTDGRTSVAWLGPEPTDAKVNEALEKVFVLVRVDADETNHPGLPLLLVGEFAAETARISPDVLQWYYDNGFHIVLTDASASNLNSILDAMTTGIPRQAPAFDDNANWWGIRPETGAVRTKLHRAAIETEESLMGPNFKEQLEKVAWQRAFESLSDWFAEPDTVEQTRIRKGALQQLATDSGRPTMLSEEEFENLWERSTTAPQDVDVECQKDCILANLAKMYTSEIIYYVYMDNSLEICKATDSDCAQKAAQYPYAKYTLNATGYTAYSCELGTDWWLFLLHPVLAQSTAMTEHHNSQYKWFVDFYKVFSTLIYDTSADETNSYCGKIWQWESDTGAGITTCAKGQCYNGPNDQGLVPMVVDPDINYKESSPLTTPNCTQDTVTASTSSSFTGTAGFAGTGGTGSVSNTMSTSTSNSYTTKSVCVKNTSDTDIYDQVVVNHDITNPDIPKTGTGCYKKIDTPSGDATETFEPYMAWVWTTTEDVRTAATSAASGDTVALQLCGAFEFGWLNWKLKDSGNIECLGSGYHKIEKNEWWAFVFYNLMVPFAPIPPNPPNDDCPSSE